MLLTGVLGYVLRKLDFETAPIVLGIVLAPMMELSLRPQQVAGTLALSEEGATVPFIARYRKEATGNLDEVQIETIQRRSGYLDDLAARKGTVLASIAEQGKLTDELRAAIEATRSKTELEDLYLPYRPKRRTRASMRISVVNSAARAVAAGVSRGLGWRRRWKWLTMSVMMCRAARSPSWKRAYTTVRTPTKTAMPGAIRSPCTRRSLSPGYTSSIRSRTSRRVSPGMVTFVSPPVRVRSGAGMWTRAMV